jgi:hypothetical protein
LTLLLAALLVGSIWVSPSAASPSDACRECHGAFAENHGSIDHSATPANTPMSVAPGWTYGDCGLCHFNDLITIHGNNCATCHPTPYDSLGTWGRGCQQGACHPVYHEDSATSHLPFESWDESSGNDCEVCHDPVSWEVAQPTCPNCHATYGAGDISPPVTTSDAIATYSGPARIVFSITDNGKVGIGTTFYRLDGGAVAAGSQVLVNAPGAHDLEFWSMDQSGNVESPTNRVSFSIIEDSTPPTTTSNAQAAYCQGAQITLTATDAGAQGVKNTYFSLNGSSAQIGTTVNIPATSGTIDYTLLFWSEDWAGNIESPNSVNFTVTSGFGTLRLVWGNSDTNSEEGPVDEDMASWTIRVGNSSGKVVASGSDSGPDWSGVNEVVVPVSLTPYHVRVSWNDFDETGDTAFSNVNLTTPGQIVRLSY